MVNKNWLKVLVALSAILIAGSAAYFSVTGLGVLFSGAAIAVMVMASSLEFAKLVTATYLKQEWDNIKGVNKWYLTSAVVILMAITSAGIFGYLSNAFQQQNLKLDQVQREIDVWNNKIKTDTAQRTLYIDQLNQLQSNNNAVLSSNTNKSGLRFASSTGREQSKIRAKITAINDSVISYNAKINEIKNANIGIEREVGGFRFVAEAFGVELNSVVKFFIILIVIVFDPLAVALVISFNQLVTLPKRKEDEESTDPNVLKDFVDESARLQLTEDDIKKLEEVLLNPPAPNEKLKEAVQIYKDNVIEKHTQESNLLTDDEILKKAQEIQTKKIFERVREIEKIRESIHGPILPEDEPVGALANSGIRERLEREEMEREELERDEEPYAGPMEPHVSDNFMIGPDGAFEYEENQEENIFQEEPTIDEEEQNFSTMEQNFENIFQEEVVVEPFNEEIVETNQEEIVESLPIPPVEEIEIHVEMPSEDSEIESEKKKS